MAELPVAAEFRTASAAAMVATAYCRVTIGVSRPRMALRKGSCSPEQGFSFRDRVSGDSSFGDTSEHFGGGPFGWR